MIDRTNDIIESLQWIFPEIVLAVGFLLIIIAGLFKVDKSVLVIGAMVVFAGVAISVATQLFENSPLLFGMLKRDAFGSYIKILVDLAAIFTCILSIGNIKDHRSEYFSF